MTDENPFIRFWRQGYARLLPVVPPEAGIRDAGKRPGLKGSNGWYGTSVRLYNATEADCRAWHEMGAGVGLRCDGTFIALDIDTLSPQWVKIIRDLAFEHLGPAPIRIGRDPKELLLYLTDGAIDYQQMRFDDGVEDKKTGLVEMLTGAEGTKWFVMHGVHPVTKRPYRWPAGTPDAATLSRVTAEQVQTFFEALASVLPAAKGAGTVSADRVAIDQAKLKGDVEMIKRAIETIPNDPGRIGYQEWMTMAAALRGACQDDYALGLELFQDWSEKADLDTQTENPARVYGSIQPPFSLGADYLFSKAAAEDPAFVAARYWEPVEDTPLFPDSAPNAFSTSKRELQFEPFYAAADRAFDESAQPLVDGLLDQGTLSMVFGESNVGKTFVVLDIAYAIATGGQWFGFDTEAGGVLYVAAEGGGKIRQRFAALTARHGRDAAVAMDLLNDTVDLRRDDADTRPLIAKIKAQGRPLSLIVVDTLSRAMAGGDENSPVDMGAIVRNVDLIRKHTAAHVMVVHHSGKTQAAGARGHSLLRAAIDTEIEIVRGEIRVTKQRDLDGEWSAGFVLDVHVIGVTRKGKPVTSCTVRRVMDGSADGSGAGKISAKEGSVMAAVAEITARGDASSGISVADLVAFLEDTPDKLSKEAARKHIERLVKKGLLTKCRAGFWKMAVDRVDTPLVQNLFD